MTEPYPGWHCIVIDEVPSPEGWGVHCTPHGFLGWHDSHLEAFKAALDHDERHCGNGVV